jgi:2-polyprenyl-3-methyl-5-hydroxy-6-metoxy-1,4-benzoquinol methylase
MLIDKKPKEQLDIFLEEYNKFQKINIEKAKRIIVETIKYYNTRGSIHNSYAEILEDRWYNALEEYKIDYSVYNDRYYFTDLWVCWKMYSRNYLRSIIKDEAVSRELKNIKSIVDLGCGIGYTTASLKQLFKRANVYGTNIEKTRQYKFCKSMSKKYNFKLASDISKINRKIDLVFASEYFEHIQYTTDHLLDIIIKLSPKYFYIANAFNTVSVGHFEVYKYRKGVIATCFLSQQEVSKVFNKILSIKYERVKTKLWNNKPTLWKRKGL